MRSWAISLISKSIRVSVGAIAIALFAACGANSAASPQPSEQSKAAVQGEDDDGNPRKFHGRHGQFGAADVILARSLRLELKPEQRTKIEALRAQLDPAKNTASVTARKELRQLLSEGLSQGAIDRTKADAKVEDLVKSVQLQQDAMLDSLNQLHSILDANQRTELVNSLAARKHEHGKGERGHWNKGEKGKQKGHGPGFRHGGRDGRADWAPGKLKQIAREIGLSSEQVSRIRARAMEGMQHEKVERPDRKQARERLRAAAEAFKGDRFDARTVGMGQEMSVQARRHAQIFVRLVDAAAHELSPEQRKQLAQILISD